MDLAEIITGLQIGTLGPIQVLANLVVALVLSLITCFVYRKTHSGFAYNRSYNVTMIVVSMVVTMMMMVIGNYLALSLGLIGALSVIRFRTAIKDTKDMAFLFICISIGLACSTGDYVIAVIGTLAIDSTLLALHYLRFDSSVSSDYILTFHLNNEDGDVKPIMEKAGGKFNKTSFRSFCQLTKEMGEFVYSIKLGDISEEDAIEHLKREAPMLFNVSLIAPEASFEI